MTEYELNLNEFLLQEESRRNEILIDLQGIRETTGVYIQNENEDISPEYIVLVVEYLRRCLSVLSENENITSLCFVGFESFPFPVSLFTEWLNDQNKYVESVDWDDHLLDSQTDVKLLQNAVQTNTTINSFSIGCLTLSVEEFNFSKKIVIAEFEFEDANEPNNPDEDKEIMFLEQVLGSMKSLHLRFGEAPTFEKANAIREIISKNNSLTSLKIKSFGRDHEKWIPIIQGIVNAGIITDFEYIISSDDPDGIRDHPVQEVLQPIIFQMIGKMKKLKKFAFDPNDFPSLSADEITTTLATIPSLECLDIKAREATCELAKNVIKKVSACMTKCSLHFTCSKNFCSIVDFSGIFEVLEDVRFEKLTAYDFIEFDDELIGNCHDALTNHIPKWKFLKEINLKTYDMEDDMEDYEQLQFLMAINKSASLQQVCIVDGEGDNLLPDLRGLIDNVLKRNKLLAESIAAPASVPDWHWPLLLNWADSLGLDFCFLFSLEIMPTLFQRFLGDQNSEHDHNETSE